MGAITSPRIDALTTTWEELSAELLNPVQSSSKREVPLFLGISSRDGSRTKRGITTMDVAVLDFDGLKEAEALEVREAAAQWDHVFYTSWSHLSKKKGGGWCFRIVLPLSRSISVAMAHNEWEVLFDALYAHFGAHPDRGAAVATQPFYLHCINPDTPPPAAPLAYADFGPRGHLNPDEFLRNAPDAPLDFSRAEVMGSEPLSVVDVKAHISRLRRRRVPDTGLLSILQSLVDGRPWASQGARDETLNRTCWALAEDFPRVGADAMADLFRASLQAMQVDHPDGALTEEDVKKKWERCVTDRAVEMAHEEQEKTRTQGDLIEKAMGEGRRHGYTDEDVQRFADNLGISFEEMARAWLIQKDTTYFLLEATGEYVPYAQAEVRPSVQRVFAPAGAYIDLYKQTAQGQARKTADDLVEEYGSVARGLLYDMSIETTQWDPRRRVLQLATAPRKAHKPEDNDTITEWLYRLCGEDDARFWRLVDWLSVVEDLHKPACALFIEGAPRTGKTMLAKGLAQLWQRATPVEMRTAMGGGFNDALRHCPLILADETVPRDWRGNPLTEELRALIQETRREMRIKYQPSSVLVGATRTIITSNDAGLLIGSKTLAREDIAAISERILHIRADQATADWLETVDTSGWVEGGGIARYVRHLQATHTRVTAPNGRFLVVGDCHHLTATMVTGSGLRGALCEALVTLALGDTQATTAMDGGMAVKDGSLWVNPQAIARSWDHFKVNILPPTASAVGQTLKGLAVRKARLSMPGTDRRPYMWEVGTPNLVIWAETNGVCSEDEIRAALNKEETKR